MRSHRVLGIFFVLVTISFAAYGQATRTWVSGVGDDANPCSRTAPCKTFAGAISKTATGGEINALDPGGFGGVTITKSITIQGADFVVSSLVSGTNAIVINAPSTAEVYLRRISLNGLGTGLSGIRVLAAGRVTIEKCNIFGFNTAIDVAPSAASLLRVAISETTIRGSKSLGVKIAPTGLAINGFVFTSLDRVEVTGTFNNGVTGGGSGLFLDGGSSTHVANSNISENEGSGVFIRNASDVSLHASSVFRNVTGIKTDVGSPSVRLFASSVYGNSTGFSIVTGTIASHGNNAIAGNGGLQTPSSVINTQ